MGSRDLFFAESLHIDYWEFLFFQEFEDTILEFGVSCPKYYGKTEYCFDVGSTGTLTAVFIMVFITI